MCHMRNCTKRVLYIVRSKYARTVYDIHTYIVTFNFDNFSLSFLACDSNSELSWISFRRRTLCCLSLWHIFFPFQGPCLNCYSFLFVIRKSLWLLWSCRADLIPFLCANRMETEEHCVQFMKYAGIGDCIIFLFNTSRSCKWTFLIENYENKSVQHSFIAFFFYFRCATRQRKSILSIVRFVSLATVLQSVKFSFAKKKLSRFGIIRFSFMKILINVRCFKLPPDWLRMTFPSE